jgi:hypothetical protein
LSFLEAVDRLGGAKPIDPAAAARRAEELARRKAEREAQAGEFRERERNSLFSIWQAAAPAEGSPVEAYLKKRCLALPPGSRLRYSPQMAYFDGETVGEDGRKYRRMIYRGPAMIAAIQSCNGKFRGLHFTYLDLNQPKGKATITDPDTGEVLVSKKSRGIKSGGHIELVRPQKFSRLVIGEGIETVLAAWCASDDGETAFWSAIDLGNIGGRAAAGVLHPTLKDNAGRRRRVPGPEPGKPGDHPPLDIPDDVHEVIILGDGDSDPTVTENALRRASKRWARPGRTIRIAWAPTAKDFNDLPIEEARALLAAARPFGAPTALEVEVQSQTDNGKATHETIDDFGEQKNEKKKQPSAPKAAEPTEAGTLGFDIDKMNERFAHVVLGGKQAIYWENPTAPVEQRKKFVSLDAFYGHLANRFTEVRDGAHSPHSAAAHG